MINFALPIKLTSKEMSSNAINIYIANHNAPSITDFVEFLSMESIDAGLKPIISHQLFPMQKILLLNVLARALIKI